MSESPRLAVSRTAKSNPSKNIDCKPHVDADKESVHRRLRQQAKERQLRRRLHSGVSRTGGPAHRAQATTTDGCDPRRSRCRFQLEQKPDSFSIVMCWQLTGMKRNNVTPAIAGSVERSPATALLQWCLEDCQAEPVQEHRREQGKNAPPAAPKRKRAPNGLNHRRTNAPDVKTLLQGCLVNCQAEPVQEHRLQTIRRRGQRKKAPPAAPKRKRTPDVKTISQ